LSKPKNPLNRANKVNKLPASAQSSSDTDWRRRHPLFSLEHTVSGYCVADCSQEQKVAFANTLLTLSKQTWLQIMQADRRKGGSEKIARRAISRGIPTHVTEDVDEFTALRFCGRAPMVGYVDKGVFYILWLDKNFDLYDHG
jgi:hypothetical protein